ncbi:hypothetical protein [Oceanibaculum pacificum]|uniref:Uncharacterized protein n=1 Tax=Oceanibaculum pacificum TaxID=580166 RepID=A0A154W329_9PROT|nr:hypothetical protein [Oceanibaculum pacificum]KZD07857.1 hypothetical protein AUP43_09550 [Oceanibaculum pacificum]
MAARSTETMVTFRRPFSLSTLDAPQPAGTYLLVIEEEDIDGLSFLAFRRTATLLQVPAQQTGPTAKPRGGYQMYPVDAAEFEAARRADQASL